MIVALHHAQITVPKGAEDEARRFYCGLLELNEVSKRIELAGRGGFWLEIGDRQLHIGTEDDVERSATKAHIAYEVEDLETWREKLTASGIPVKDGIQIPGMRRFEFRDPFGNRIEFLQVRNP
ncbi:MAG TPA: VOC family protein [Pyrinomonadaceae bacterium]|nr:VOC family protein [Pyrinomonadaceae bacterium]